MARFSYNETYNPSRVSTSCNYTTAGTYSWTVPSGITCATFEVWGAGGGGGAKCCCECYHISHGGGSGGYSAMTIPVTAGNVYTICVGYGGNVASYGDTSHAVCFGGDGGTSYVTGNGITTLCATGGSGSHNNCYSYCMCSNCGGITLPQSTATPTNAASSSSVNGTCYVCGNGWRQRHAFTTLWTDSSSHMYSGITGGVPFSSSELFTNEACSRARSACRTSRHSGNGGQGSMNSQICTCALGYVGRSGKVVIKF